MLEFFRSRRLLQDKIDDLNRHTETLQGASYVLERELNKAQMQEQNLLNKIFQLTGLVEQKREVIGTAKTDLSSIAQPSSWSQVKRSLEQTAQEKYWIKKKQEQEAQEKAEMLEKEKNVS